MRTSLVEILDCGQAGYSPLVNHGEWRVASLRPGSSPIPEQLDVVERHTETDEVFVLLGGKVLLVIAGNGPRPSSIQPMVMEPGKVYNVRQDTWHTALLSQDSLVLVVENRDTGAANTESLRLSPTQRSRVLETWAAVG